MSPERFARISQLLDQRQPDLTLCLESVHKNHNLNALVRTADAVGLHEVHAVWYDEQFRLSRGAAVGSEKWVKVIHHDGLEPALEHFRAQDQQVLVTHLSPEAVDFRSVDYTKPTVIDRKSTRLNSSHVRTSYAVFCLKKKNKRLLRQRWRTSRQL